MHLQGLHEPVHPRPTRVRTWLSLIPTRCWLTSPSAHYVTLCYAGLILLFNMLVLVGVVAVLRRTRQQQQQRARKDWMTVLGLTCLLGTTWGTAFCAFGVLLVPQLYLFTVLNSLQGQQPGGILGGGGFPSSSRHGTEGAHGINCATPPGVFLCFWYLSTHRSKRSSHCSASR